MTECHLHQQAILPHNWCWVPAVGRGSHASSSSSSLHHFLRLNIFIFLCLEFLCLFFLCLNFLFLCPCMAGAGYPWPP